MIFQRGNPMDYERWAGEPGMESWAYAHCLPYFKRMESCLAGADEFRGGDGPLVLERGPATSPLFEAFFEAVQQAGYPLTDDVNGARQEGFAAFDRTIHRGRRLSAARAYLHPVLHRPNLSVQTRQLVTRILFDGTRAVGVEAVERARLRRDEPLRGGRVPALERRRRVPEPHVPLPAARDPLRRQRARGPAWISGAYRSHVLRRARIAQDHLGGSARASCAAVQLRLD